ncbi:MAG: transcriptional repressor [Nitriliruptoraceae bacterium]
MSATQASQRNPTIARTLLDAQIRVTDQRVAILETLGRRLMAMTAAEIYTRLRRSGSSVSLATIYRNLRILEESGLVHTMTIAGEQAFSRCPGEHEHVRCHACGRVVQLTGLALVERIGTLLEREDMELVELHLDVVGVCVRCRIG